MFSRFNTIAACDERTDRQTGGQTSCAYSSRGKNCSAEQLCLVNASSGNECIALLQVMFEFGPSIFK